MAFTLNSYAFRPRVFILTDITNEPDDAQSFCRYLTYSNQFDTKGIVPTTSVWLRDKVAPEALYDIVDGYAEVVDNLNTHAHPSNPYPSPEHIRSLIKLGSPVYGMEAVGDDIPLSEGAELLRASLEADDSRPLWVLAWGGTNVLAAVLYRIRSQRNAQDLRQKLRVYTTSDQDDTGAWIRHQWPDLFYICSVHGWNQYDQATWIGISGDIQADRGGADRSMVSPEWIRENLQIGPLGKKYPDVMYAMEGDTPTFLYLIQNGLGDAEQPSWGSWGGRYIPANVSAKGTPSRGHFADCSDTVVGVNGEPFTSNRATIWRWRNAFQRDFAARIQWTLCANFSGANHAPVAIVNGDQSLAPLYLDVEAGTSITVDASQTYDPDGDEITFEWYQYLEPGAIATYHTWEAVPVSIASIDGGQKAEITVPPAEKSCTWNNTNGPGQSVERGSPIHVILEVNDNGTPTLTSYRRIVITPFRR